MPTLTRSQWLDLPRKEVFAFFADAANLQQITPPELRFEILSPLPIAMRPGAEIEYKLSLFGVRFGWLTEISEWSPDDSFVDRQIRGPYRSWVHRHSFSDEHGGTRMEDRVDYSLPLAPLGDIARPVVAWQLRRIFDYRRERIEKLLG